ncbi:acyltransferase [Alkalimonas collagenimarina]|uniref:Acyltransferase n=1 Tax=Alkalimonas collagenimarina TaxID=400390 RepID=A0ABT9GZ74_9GAMM|nr:acyltransferase [Alkalimonas collagenimarina]MDP4536358.1 acyltransferase [Alkalimonas collagenimarina]
MNTSLSNFASGRDNNFNLIRFIAATAVLFSHCYPLFYGSSGSDPLKSLVGISLGTVAVDLFFISSGFLIAGSLFNRKNLTNFVKARVLRIYPALAICLLLTVLILGPIFTTLPLSHYFTNSQTYIYFFKNLILFFGEEATLPGVFAGLPWPNTVNGSLWTLPFEVRAYALLVIVGLLLHFCEMRWIRLPTKVIYLLIPIIGMGLYLFNHFYKIFPVWYFGSEYARLFSMFFIGVAYYKYQEKIPLSHTLFAVSAILLCISSLHSDSFFVVYNLSLSYVLFYLAYVPTGIIRKFNQYGDYSYGIYIYAFPVQQAVMYVNPDIVFLNFLCVSLFITFIFAYLSWQFIEERSLKLKSKTLRLFNKKQVFERGL